jgi:hypothetical protein
MTRSLVLVFATLSLAAGACAVDDDALGTADFALTGHSPSGTLYRLRHADLTIAGAGTMQVFHTEDAPDAPSISAHLPAGAYTIDLAPAWSLERVNADGTAVTVDATLLSDNPLGFDVSAGGLTPVVLRFQAGADQVGMGDGDVDVSIGVDDPVTTPPIIFTNPPALSVIEGSSAAIQVLLSSRPATNVTVVISTSSPAVAVTPSVLTFTPTNYAAPQVITVTGVSDPDSDPAFATLALSAAGSPTAIVQVNVIDDDVAVPPSILVDVPAATVVEGAAVSFAVHLSSPPSGPFPVQVVGSDPSVAIASPAVLTFDAMNWNAPQVVTVVAVQDVNTSNESTILKLVAPGAPSATVLINVVDDDVQKILVTPPTLDVVEGASATVQVMLAFQPPANTTITLSSADPSRLAINMTALTFTPVNYATPMLVTVTAVPDPDSADNFIPVTLSGAGLPAQQLLVKVHEAP